MSKNKIIGIIVLCFVVLPATAFAWGPGVHLSLGLYLLNNLSLLIPAVADIIWKHQWYFLYGCISPDVLIGKGKKISRTHSHNWDTALKIIDVNDPEIIAYGFGYLSHLAADVVAHNYFVPNMLQLFKLSRGKIFHILIEGYVDRNIKIDQTILRELINSNFKKADTFLIKTVQKKKTIFKIKKAIFKKGISINFFKSINSQKSKYSVIEKRLYKSWDYVEEMLHISRKAVINCLNKKHLSELIEYDPMGFNNLKIAKKSNKITFKNRHRGVVPFFVPSMNLLNL
jgi:hypothetical protein